MHGFSETQIQPRRIGVLARPAAVAGKMVDAQSRHARWVSRQVESAYITAAVLLSLGFLYASTVPLVFGVLGIEARFWGMFRVVPQNPEELVDLIRNTLAFIPLGFFWSAACRTFLGFHRRQLGTFGPAMIACLGLATLAEVLQVWIPVRDPSARDILSLECGAMVGYGLWILAGAWTTAFLRRWTHRLYLVGGPRLFRLQWQALFVTTLFACWVVNCYASPAQLFLLYRFRSTSLHEVAGLLHDTGVQQVRGPLSMFVPSVTMALFAVGACRMGAVTLRFLRQRCVPTSRPSDPVGVPRKRTPPQTLYSCR